MARLGAVIRGGTSAPRIALRVLPVLAAAYIRLVRRTTRWTIEGRGHFEALVSGERGFVSCLWHGRLLMAAGFVPPGRRSIAMISRNRDGDMIAAVVRRFGVSAVRGSSYDRAKGRDKDGREAYAGAAAELRRGSVVAITPDGPRGPRMRAQAGVALLALETGAAVLPIAFSTRRGRFLRTWDRFLLPLPFDRGALVFGAPIRPEGRGLDGADALRAEIETATTAVTERADRLMGRAPIHPDPLDQTAAKPSPSAGGDASLVLDRGR